MCKYIDIPLQHIDNDLLLSMRRKHNEQETRDLVKLIRSEYPEIALRSTFIVGYPGENGKKYKKLCQFIKDAKIDYAGFFPYSREPNTASYYMKKQVPEFIKKLRAKKINKIQQNITSQMAQSMIGQEMEVLVDEFDETTGEFCAHGEKTSPLVDFGVRFVDNGSVNISQIVKVKIYDFDGSNYKGEIL